MRDLVIIAEAQNGGRGRKDGRVFHSPKGGIYMSLLLHPTLLPCEAQKLTAFAAVAVAEAIESLVNADVKIKWVNDVLINQKKICGILTESAIGPDRSFEYLVVGIGINLSSDGLPKELSGIASSIEAECGAKLLREQLIAEILKRMRALADSALPDSFMDAYRYRSCVLGKKLCVHGESSEYYATALEIDDGGSLTVLTEDNRKISLNSGEVSIKI